MSRSVERRLHYQQEHAKCITCRAEVEDLRAMVDAYAQVYHRDVCVRGTEFADCPSGTCVRARALLEGGE